MKLLLDECVTHSLRRDLAGHEVHTVEDAGLKGLENGSYWKPPPAPKASEKHLSPSGSRFLQAIILNLRRQR